MEDECEKSMGENIRENKFYSLFFEAHGAKSPLLTRLPVRRFMSTSTKGYLKILMPITKRRQSHGLERFQ